MGRQREVNDTDRRRRSILIAKADCWMGGPRPSKRNEIWPGYLDEKRRQYLTATRIRVVGPFKGQRMLKWIVAIFGAAEGRGPPQRSFWGGERLVSPKVSRSAWNLGPVPPGTRGHEQTVRQDPRVTPPVTGHQGKCVVVARRVRV